MKVSASILSANFLNLKDEIDKISKAGADFIHIDVMDGHFVPNLTMGPCIINSIKPYSKVKFDVHLMIDNPMEYYKDYIKAGADILTFHIEAYPEPINLINKIRSENCKVGLSIKPDTSEEAICRYLEHIDLLLVMAVNPGFGGQKFMNSVIPKISNLASKIKSVNKEIILSVDGGINDKTALLAAEAGATMLVSGSYLFENQDFCKAVVDLKSIM